MELSSFDIKKKLYFLKRKLFLYFRKWNPALSKPKPKNFRKWNFLALILKKKIMFSQKKAFFYIFSKNISHISFSKAFQKSLYFRKRNFRMLQEKNIQNPGITELSYIFRNGAFYPYISLIFQEVTFQA